MGSKSSLPLFKGGFRKDRADIVKEQEAAAAGCSEGDFDLNIRIKALP